MANTPARPLKFAFIYSITNKETGRIYIGSTNRKLKVRWLEHKKRLRNGAHVNKELQLHYDAHPKPISLFRFKLVEKCDPALINEREQYWTDYYKEHNTAGVYNTGEDVHLTFKGRKHTDETRAKIGATLKATLAANKGVTDRSEERDS